MTEEHRRRLLAWVEDLESGLHRQTSSYLHRTYPDEPDRFCCLGRLCVLAIDDGLEIETKTVTDCFAVTYDGGVSYPTHRVVEWAGLDDFNVHVYATMNHDDGVVRRRRRRDRRDRRVASVPAGVLRDRRHVRQT